MLKTAIVTVKRPPGIMARERAGVKAPQDINASAIIPFPYKTVLAH